MADRPQSRIDNLTFLTQASHEAPADPASGELPGAIARLEESMIRKALETCGGNRSEAARRLGIHRQLLHAKMRLYGLEQVR